MSASSVPPPPPESPLVQIARKGEIIGSWPPAEICSMFVAGTLKSSDYFWVDGAENWRPLFPHTTALPFHYPRGEETSPVFYIKNGHLFGPRTLLEVAAAVEGGVLSSDTQIAFVGADRWYTWAELQQEGEAGTGQPISDQKKESIWPGVFAQSVLLSLAGVHPVAAVATSLLATYPTEH